MIDLEDRIERLVRYPHTLQPDERDALTRLTSTDPTAERLAKFYKSFYDELDSTPMPPEPDRPE